MERLLMLKLDALGCDAEAWLNGIPLARVDAAQPRAVLAVHEFTVAGPNRLELVVWPHAPTLAEAERPPPLDLVATGQQAAQVRVLLPRAGGAVDENSARSLAQLVWAPAAGTAYQAPHRLMQEVQLPVSFPRWRWLDAPAVQEHTSLRAPTLALLQAIAADLANGEVERYLAATRLRSEELAVAYLRQPQDLAQRLREQLLEWHGQGRLNWQPLEAEGLCLRSMADGRLFECLGADGLPALRTLPDAQGRVINLPLRMAAVEGKLYVLR